MSNPAAPPTPPAPAGTSLDGARLAPEGASAVQASERSSTAAADSLGLSKAHISPTNPGPRPGEYVVQIARGGNLVRVCPPKPDWLLMPSKAGGGRRERVAVFSAASRRRMIRLLCSLDQTVEAVPLLVTLTYPGDPKWNQLDPTKAKRDLDTFFKRLGRSHYDAHAIWKLEPQQRGAPHFHLLLFGVGFIPIDDLSRMWWETVGSGDLANLSNGVDVRKVDSWRRVMGYVAKYVSKTVDELPLGWDHVGRWWGVFRRKRFTINIDSICVSPATGARARRVVARLMFRRDREARYRFLARDWLSATGFGPEETWRRLLDCDAMQAHIRCKPPTRGRPWYLARLHRLAGGDLPGSFTTPFDV